MLGAAYADLGRTEEALSELRAAHRERERLHGADHPNTAMVELSLGRELTAAGHADQGEPLLRHAAEVLTWAQGFAESGPADAETQHAEALLALGRAEEASAAAHRGLAIAVAAADPGLTAAANDVLTRITAARR